MDVDNRVKSVSFSIHMFFFRTNQNGKLLNYLMQLELSKAQWKDQRTEEGKDVCPALLLTCCVISFKSLLIPSFL